MLLGTGIDWKLIHRPVSRQFRAILERELPGLGTDERLWTMLEYLLFPWRDDETRQPLAPASLITDIGGTRLAITFLREFSAKVVPLTWKDWSYTDGSCRVITSIDWPAPVAEAIEAEFSRQWKDAERVYLRTGNKVTHRTVGRERTVLAQAAAEYAKTAKEAQKRLLRYLNDQPSNAFSLKVKENIDQAYELAKKIEDHYERQYAFEHLVSIQYQAKPYYRPSLAKRTARVFSINDSLLTLRSDIRHVLTKGWIELDLRNAQFAVAAMLWNIDSINDYLRNNGSVWDELIRYFDGRVSKPLLKLAVYRIVNGGSKRETKFFLDRSTVDGTGDHFFRHPLIVDLWKSSRHALQAIKRNRGANDCFGNWIAYEGDHRNNNAPSIIAQRCQSYELLVLLPALYLAERTDEFMITLWQHDGFSISVRDSRREEEWIRRIAEAVEAEADRFRIRTTLERTN